MNSKLKIYFYSPGFTLTRPIKEFHGREKVIFFNPTPLYLDSYVKRTEPELKDQYEWTHLQYLPLVKEEFIKQINDLEIDILAVSVYTWNNTHILNNIKDIHQLVKKPLKVIIGGPSVNVVRHDDWLLDLSDVNFAVYSQGEKPFVSILKHCLGIEKVSLLKDKNIAWVENGRVKKADYEFLRVTNASPIVEARDLLEQIINQEHLKDWLIHFPYETSRGCPYNCSFCDWTSGLSHKVSKRKYAYEDELETLGSLGIVNLYMADANFGMFPEDVGIAETMARLKKEKGYQFWIHGNNFAKTKKDQVFKIADILLAADIVPYMKFSIQDVHEHILDNIDRPDIAWSKHVQYMMDLRKKHPRKIFALDIIKGLPGQTRETWEETFRQICPYDIQMDVYDWEIIANSPAGYDKEYQARMKLQTHFASDINDPNRRQEDIIETYSYNKKDYAYFTVLYQFYHIFFRNYAPAFPRFIDILKGSKHLDRFVDQVEENLTDKLKIRSLILEFIKDIFKENFRFFTNDFIKKSLHIHLRLDNSSFIPNNGAAVIRQPDKTPEEILALVYR